MSAREHAAVVVVALDRLYVHEHGEQYPERDAALAALAALVAEVERLTAERDDARSGLRYIEQRYGRLEGVGWDRVLPLASGDPA